MILRRALLVMLLAFAFVAQAAANIELGASYYSNFVGGHFKNSTYDKDYGDGTLGLMGADIEASFFIPQTFLPQFELGVNLDTGFAFDVIRPTISMLFFVGPVARYPFDEKNSVSIAAGYELDVAFADEGVYFNSFALTGTFKRWLVNRGTFHFAIMPSLSLIFPLGGESSDETHTWEHGYREERTVDVPLDGGGFGVRASFGVCINLGERLTSASWR